LINHKLNRIVTLIAAVLVSSSLLAQIPSVRMPRGLPTLPNIGGNTGGQSAGMDSLKHRIDDSITLRYYVLDSIRGFTLDSSISDFTKRFPVPSTYVYLGNTGSPAHSLLFSPLMKEGWDPGFHELDIYKWNLDKAQFFNTTKPYTELGYMLATRAEQMIQVLHTQNIRPSFNVSFQYRLINAPGIFRNQRTNHNNYLVTTWYQSPSKRYNNYFIFLNNHLQEGESGGIKSDKNYLNDPSYSIDRFSIPTNIGGEPTFGTDFFSTILYTGRQEKEMNVLMRQQLDFGRKDSLVTDSVVIPLFYPRLRFEHTFKYGSYSYLYQDLDTNIPSKIVNVPDSAYYASHYGFNLANRDTSILIQDKWKELNNDFSIYQFPDEKNLNQFIKLGMEMQILHGELRSTTSIYNMIAHGEYRNRTKNKKWDMEAFGRLYLTGTDVGNYHAYIHLERVLSQQLGSLMVGFENVNRSPSYIYNPESHFYLDVPKTFLNENNTHFFASILEPKYKWQLRGDYYLVSNYLYVNNYYKLQQENAFFNVLRVSAFKTFSIGKNWKWHSETYLQQKTGNVPVHFPLIYTRNRFALEGLFFRNLNLATGLEIRYHTPYKADNYSPVIGQFFYQDSITINNRPQVDLFMNFRIKSFKAYIRAENLNAASLEGGFHFNHNNFAAPYYPIPGMIIRLGIFWSFID
jgi:hypothetical protein